MARFSSIAILACLWAAWCFLHSFLISGNFTWLLQKKLGKRFRYYRLAYVIFSTLSLVPVVYFQLLLPARMIFAWPWPWRLAKYGMYGAAVLLFYGGFRVYDIQYILGIRQIRTMEPEPTGKTPAFTTTGILGYVRHPWYSGAILLVWAFGSVTDVSLVSKAMLTLYIIIGTLLEERKLIGAHGAPYLAYRARVPMYIPWKKG